VVKRMALVIPLAAGVMFAATASPLAASQTTRPPSGLTASGRTLWNFEGLLTGTFGNAFFGVRVRGLGYPPNFVGQAACPTMAACHTYRFAFARHSATGFHLTAVRPTGTFGNYPQLVRVRGEYVACNAAKTQYLITYADTMNFGVACLRPG
jgi:hypothetical protein